MPFLVTARRAFIAAWQHFIRNVWLVVTTVFVLTLALLSVNILLGVNLLLTNAVRTLESKLDISVYFAQSTPSAILEQAKFFMLSLPQVKSVELLTSEQALANFKQRHAKDVKLLSALSEIEKNPLGASLIIKARHASDYPFLTEALKNPQFNFAIESQNFETHADTIQRVRDLSRSVKIFGSVLVAIFGLFSGLIVYNTVRITIYTQREEIGVMRLVGASNAFVRWPFVLEGIILAFVTAVITAALVCVMALYADVRLSGLFDGAASGLKQYFTQNIVLLSLIEGGVLALLVAFSSWAAVGKYLKR